MSASAHRKEVEFSVGILVCRLPLVSLRRESDARLYDSETGDITDCDPSVLAFFACTSTVADNRIRILARVSLYSRAAEAGIDVGTLASLPGDSKLVGYALRSPRRRPSCRSCREVGNRERGARQIAEFEKKEKTALEGPATVSATVQEKAPISEDSESATNSHQTN
jgi:hypothetical protein